MELAMVVHLSGVLTRPPPTPIQSAVHMHIESPICSTVQSVESDRRIYFHTRTARVETNMKPSSSFFSSFSSILSPHMLTSKELLLLLEFLAGLVPSILDERLRKWRAKLGSTCLFTGDFLRVTRSFPMCKKTGGTRVHKSKCDGFFFWSS